MRWSYEKVASFITDNSDCKLVTDYFENCRNQKMESICNCGEHFKTTFQMFNLKNKRQCNKCSRINSSVKQSLGYDYVKSFIESVSDSNCKLLSKDYTNNRQKLSIECGCGKIFDVCFDKFKNRQKRSCNDCSNNKISESQTFGYQYIKKYIKSESDCTIVSSKYDGCYEDIDIKCHCDTTYTTTFANFKSSKGKQCRRCSNLYSHGEDMVEKCLIDIGLEYDTQVVYNDLRSDNGKYFLRFDFIVKIEDSLFCIEFDGRQHFEPIEYFGGNKSFKQVQKNDNRKNTYCNNNNISLLRIPYYEIDNVEFLVTNFLNV